MSQWRDDTVTRVTRVNEGDDEEEEEEEGRSCWMLGHFRVSQLMVHLYGTGDHCHGLPALSS